MDGGAIAAAVIFSVFALAGAWLDLRTQRIPNRLNAAFLLAGLIVVLVVFGWLIALWALAHFALALAAAMIIYAAGLWGGGDAKFYAAAAAWFPLTQGIALAVCVALAGLVLLLGMAISAALNKRKLTRKTDTPYGVAIALGGIAVQLFTLSGSLPAPG